MGVKTRFLQLVVGDLIMERQNDPNPAGRAFRIDWSDQQIDIGHRSVADAVKPDRVQRCTFEGDRGDAILDGTRIDALQQIIQARMAVGSVRSLVL